MLNTLFALLAAQGVVGPAPSVSGVAVATLTGGACGGPGVVSVEASIRVSWTLNNADPGTYQVKVFENGIFVALLGGSVTHWDKTITGSVESTSGGHSGTWFSNWTYLVEVVRISDGVAISSASSAAWVQQYGGCDEGSGT